MVLDFFIVFKPVNGDFWPFLGDIGLFFRPDFGRKLGNDNQIEIYKNQACLRPWRKFKENLCLSKAKPKPFLCREAVEEQMLAGHFWELRSSVLHVVSSAGF
jgi:hypothetical protein